jgi:hypothetical protein
VNAFRVHLVASEDSTMDNSNLKNDRAPKARALGVVIASVCIMGLVGMIWLHADHPAIQLGTAVPVVPAAAAAPSDAAFLHASATVFAIPSADQVFASRRGTSTDDAPAAPTF